MPRTERQLSFVEALQKLGPPSQVVPNGSICPSTGNSTPDDDKPLLRLVPWTRRERDAWRPPENLMVSEWAERYRMLSPRQAAAPGPWMNRAYYTVEPMDAILDPHVEQITIMASVQSSKTESAYNIIGYAIDQDPGPVLVAMPSLEGVRRAKDRIQLMIETSPALADHLTGSKDDLTRKEIRLDNSSVYIVTAGSSMDMRMVEARYVIRDECDSYEDLPNEGDPMSLLAARATTFWNRKIIDISTCTTESGKIAIEYARSDRRKFYVPCPRCGGYQVLSFWRIKCRGEELGKWPADKRARDVIRREDLAVYECEHCGCEIENREKRRMLRFGTWIPEGHPISRDGTTDIPRPRSSHVGYWWSALYSPWLSWSDLAAEFYEVRKDREKYKTFWNLKLTELWKEVIRHRETSEILKLRTNRPELICPPGTIAVTAGIDNQKTGRWTTIWAHTRIGDVFGSALIRYGYHEKWEDLEKWLFLDLYRIDGTGIMLPVWRAGIDTGGGESEEDDTTMTEEVYEWLRRSGRGVVFGVKGSSRLFEGGRRMKSSIIDRMPSRQGRQGRLIPGGIKLWHIDTGTMKDALWSRIESGRLDLHAATGEDFARQFAAEVKERDKRGRVAWVVQGGRANHLLDASVYAHAMADPECDGGVMVLAHPSEPVPKRPPDPPAAPALNDMHKRLNSRPVNPWAGRR